MRLAPFALLALAACQRTTPAATSDAAVGEAAAPDASASVKPAKKKRVGPPRAEQLVAYENHRCARMDDGTVQCWGGQLVAGIYPRSTDEFFIPGPRTIPGIENTSFIATGYNQTCVIVGPLKESNAVKCWGGGTTTRDSDNIGDLHLLHTSEIFLGPERGCARRDNNDGEMRCWGKAMFSLFDGDKSDEPIAVGPLSRLKLISLGKYMSCAGGLCWGRFKAGKDGPEVVAKDIWIDGPTSVRDVSVWDNDGCAVDEDGKLYCFTNTLENGKLKATRVVGPPALGEIKLTGGLVTKRQACALDAMGGVRCWDELPPKGPGTVVPNTGDALELAGRCIRTNEGAVLCWGQNARGELGTGEPSSRDKAVDVPEVKDATALALGEHHSCALTKSGEVWCWGGNEHMEVASDKREWITKPERVKGIEATSIVAGENHTCAINKDRTVTCWGNQWDNGHRKQEKIAGVQDVVQLAASGESNCALKADGTVTCFRNFDEKALEKPLDLKGVENVVEIGLTTTFLVARTRDGRAFIFGHYYGSIFGDAKPVFDTPWPIPGIENATRVVAGRHWDTSVCVLQKDRPLKCFAEKPPLKGVPSISGSEQLAVGTSFACVAGTDGVARCFGDNDRSQLGCAKGVKPEGCEPLGKEPVAVVAAGAMHACAIMKSGQLRCWGSDFDGQLGIGRILFSNEARAVTFEP